MLNEKKKNPGESASVCLILATAFLLLVKNGPLKFLDLKTVMGIGIGKDFRESRRKVLINLKRLKLP